MGQPRHEMLSGRSHAIAYEVGYYLYIGKMLWGDKAMVICLLLFSDIWIYLRALRFDVVVVQVSLSFIPVIHDLTQTPSSQPLMVEECISLLYPNRQREIEIVSALSQQKHT